jgi:hypothetical protein
MSATARTHCCGAECALGAFRWIGGAGKRRALSHTDGLRSAWSSCRPRSFRETGPSTRNGDPGTSETRAFSVN